MNESTRNTEATRWSVTVNLPDHEEESWLLTAITDVGRLYESGEVRYAVAQYERGDDTGRLHLQMYVILRDQHRGIWVTNRITGAYCVNKLAKDDAVMRRYCHNAAKPSYIRDAFEYGPWPLNSRQGERNDMADLHARIKSGEIRTYEAAIEYNVNLVARQPDFTRYILELEVMKRLNEEWARERELASPYVPKVWQFWLRKYLIESPREDRKVIFVSDQIGGAGKSRFIEEFTIEFPETCRDLTSGKSGDMACSLDIMNMRVLFFDITRSKNEFSKHVYDFAENIKSGKMFAPKYKSAMKRLPPPHIVIFTNDAVDIGGREIRERISTRERTDANGQNFASYELTEIPLSYDRYLWWELRTDHRVIWSPSPQVKWGNRFPPFRSLSAPPDHYTGELNIVPYIPPHVKTSGPEFNGDIAGDGPVSGGENRFNPSRQHWDVLEDVEVWPHPRNMYTVWEFDPSSDGERKMWCMKRGRLVKRNAVNPKYVWWKYRSNGAWYRFQAYTIDRHVRDSRVCMSTIDFDAIPPPVQWCDNEP